MTVTCITKGCTCFAMMNLPAFNLHFETADDSRSSKPVIKEGQVALPLDGSMPLDSIDEQIIKTALKRSSDNVTLAARLLGNTRGILCYWMQECGLK